MTVPTPAADALRQADVRAAAQRMKDRITREAWLPHTEKFLRAMADAAVPAVRERDDQAGERVSCVCGGPLIDGGAGEWMHANGDDARFGHRGHPATDDQAGEVVNDRYAHDTAGCCGDGENAWPTPCPTHGVTRPAEDGEPR